jgi:hypothetical protein
MIKCFSAAQFLNSCHVNIKNYQLKQFVDSRLRLKSSNNNNKIAQMSTEVYIKISEISTNKLYLDLIKKYTGQEMSQLTIFFSLQINGRIFSSHIIQTKRCDSCIHIEKNKYGLIEWFIKLENKIVVVFKQIVVLYSPFYSLLRPDIRSRSSISYISNEYKVEDIRLVNKAIIHITC